MPYEKITDSITLNCFMWKCSHCETTEDYPECVANEDIESLMPHTKLCPHFNENKEAEVPERFMILHEDGGKFTRVEINKDTSEVKVSSFHGVTNCFEQWVVESKDGDLSHLKFCVYQGQLMAHPKDQMLMGFMDDVPMHIL